MPESNTRYAQGGIAVVSDLLKDSFDYLRIPHRKAIAAKKRKARFITEILTKIYMNTIRISKEFTFEMAHALVRN